MSLEEEINPWYLDAPFIITISPSWIPPHCLGGVGRFGFAPTQTWCDEVMFIL